MGIKNIYTKNSGFTIVEVLVVIVILGILASIVVISYTAVRDNANGEAVKTDLQTTETALSKYRSDTGSYPTSSSAFTANVKQTNTSSDTTYTYIYEASNGGFCLQATGHESTYHVTEDNKNPVSGACPAVTAATTVTNRIKDPSFTVLPGASFTMSGASGTPAIITDSTAHSGATYVRLTLTSSGGNVMEYTFNSSTIDSTLSPNTPYTLSVKLRSSKNITFNAQFSWTDSGGNTTLDPATSIYTPANQWQTLHITGQSATPVTVKFRLSTAAGQSWSIGDTFDIDSMMLTQGSTVYQYKDGSYSGWSWSGTANNSSSSGPTYAE